MHFSLAENEQFSHVTQVSANYKLSMHAFKFRLS